MTRAQEAQAIVDALLGVAKLLGIPPLTIGAAAAQPLVDLGFRVFAGDAQEALQERATAQAAALAAAASSAATSARARGAAEAHGVEPAEVRTCFSCGASAPTQVERTVVCLCPCHNKPKEPTP